MQNAINLYNQKEFSECENLLKKIIKKDPQNADAWFYLGLITLNFKKFDIAISLFNKAIAIKPVLPPYN